MVYIENKNETKEVGGKKVTTKRTVEEVINIATIRDRFSKRFQISGLDGTDEARNLSLLLRSGALAAPVDIVEERTVGPSLGKENIAQGVRSFEIGFLLVALVVLFYYKVFGIVANIFQYWNQMFQIVAINRANIVETQFLEQGAAGDHATGITFCLMGGFLDAAWENLGEFFGDMTQAAIFLG